MSSRRTPCGWMAMAALAALIVAAPAAARAQYTAPQSSDRAIGERYHVEISGTLWNPLPTGVVSSEQFGHVGSDLDFTTDLGFERTRFKDLRLVLRPATKHRFRIQHTPVAYESETTLPRDVVFNGQLFRVALPVAAGFAWNVWRIGYEYDFVYRDRGFVGILVEGRYTEFTASLASRSPLLVLSEFTSAKAPLPAIGIVGRAYPVKNLAINFEVSGMDLPSNILPKYQANYYDWDINGTLNFTNNVGMQIGWRRMTTFILAEHDTADFKFQGLWFGAALRY